MLSALCCALRRRLSSLQPYGNPDPSPNPDQEVSPLEIFMAINTDGSDTLKMERRHGHSAAFIGVAPQLARCPGRLVRTATCLGCSTHPGGGASAAQAPVAAHDAAVDEAHFAAFLRLRRMSSRSALTCSTSTLPRTTEGEPLCLLRRRLLGRDRREGVPGGVGHDGRGEQVSRM